MPLDLEDPVAVARAAKAGEAAAFNLTDLGNAERLVAAHGDDVRHVPGLGWHIWDGRRFRRDDDGEIVRRMKATVRDMLAAAATLDDDDRRKGLTAHAYRSEAENRIRAAIALAATDEQVITRLEDLEAHPLTLNVANGVLHLEVGEILEHDRELLLTKLAPVPFEPDAQAPTWDAFLETVMGGDTEAIEFLRRAVGYSLTGLTNEQVIFILYGTGANGKTTFIETLRALFGEYGQQTPAETFLERRESIPNDVARLPGARFVAAVETPEGRRLNETMVKRLVGGDTMAARFMRGEWFEFAPIFKAWLATNHRPVIRGTDEAIWRRIRLVPFTVTIPECDRDRDLAAKLRAELPGILRWAAEGCRDWLANGLGPPAAISAATRAYRAEMDVLGSFLDDCCLLAPNAKAKAGDLYAEFTAWATRTGERERLTQTAFGLRLAEKGFQSSRNGRARWWSGIGLLTDDPGGGDA